VTLSPKVSIIALLGVQSWAYGFTNWCLLQNLPIAASMSVSVAALAGVRASGGTSIRCGMLHAEMSLQKRPEQLKHLIVLHDGCPSETPADMQPVIERIRRIGEVFSIYTVSESTYEHHIQIAQTKLEEFFGAKHFTVCPMKDAARSWCVYIKQGQRVRGSRT
jgi:hypothetical protein